MKRTRGLLFVSLIGLAAACSELATPVDPNSNGGAQGNAGRNSKAGGNGQSDGGDGSSASGGKGSQGGGNGNSGNGGADGGGVLSLTNVEAQVVGRFGDSVRFTVTGTRPDSGVYSIAVTFEDGDSMPIKVFDGAWDGAASAADGRIPFDLPVKDRSFTATATTAPISNIGNLVKAKVSLIDGGDHATDEVEVKIATQKELALGEPCDLTNVVDRCAGGQSCSGKPGVCTDGVAPTIAEVKYLHGPAILVRGTDPDDDLSIIHAEYLDASNKPVVIDQDTMATTFDYPAHNRSLAGVFFEQETPSVTVEKLVARVRVTAIDSLGHQSTPTTADLAYPVRAGDGITCDPRGFIACIQDYVCGPGLSPTAGKCVKLKNARTTECTADAKLDPEKGITTAAGRIDGTSLWDPPSTCTNAENVGRPEASVSLHLGSAVSKLTVSTQRPETSIDTVAYLMPACASDTSTSLGCNDDGLPGGYASSFTVNDVPAGDYTIVIESALAAGGPFGVAVSIE